VSLKLNRNLPCWQYDV